MNISVDAWGGINVMSEPRECYFVVIDGIEQLCSCSFDPEESKFEMYLQEEDSDGDPDSVDEWWADMKRRFLTIRVEKRLLVREVEE